MSHIAISNLTPATEDSFLTELQDTDATQVVGGTFCFSMPTISFSMPSFGCGTSYSSSYSSSHSSSYGGGGYGGGGYGGGGYCGGGYGGGGYGGGGCNLAD